MNKFEQDSDFDLLEHQKKNAVEAKLTELDEALEPLEISAKLRSDKDIETNPESNEKIANETDYLLTQEANRLNKKIHTKEN